MRRIVTLPSLSGTAKFSARLWNSQKDNAGGTMMGFFSLPTIITMSDEDLLTKRKKCLFLYKGWGRLARGTVHRPRLCENRSQLLQLTPAHQAEYFASSGFSVKLNATDVFNANREVVMNSILINADRKKKISTSFCRLLATHFENILPF